MLVVGGDALCMIHGTYTYFVICNNTARGSSIIPQALLTLCPGVMDLVWDTRWRPDPLAATFKPRLSSKQSPPPTAAGLPSSWPQSIKIFMLLPSTCLTSGIS